jgi:hypothetical protein
MKIQNVSGIEFEQRSAHWGDTEELVVKRLRCPSLVPIDFLQPSLADVTRTDS